MEKFEFPFINVPAEARPIVGEPTPGTRLYRREGTYEQYGEWFETLQELFKSDVGLSPGGVTMYVPVSRSAVHKRLKDGKLTGFAYYVTTDDESFFGKKRIAKQRPYIVLSISECKAWAEEYKRRKGYSYDDLPGTQKEAEAIEDFVQKDPKDKGNKRVVYKEPMSREEIIALVQITVHEAVKESLKKFWPSRKRK